MTRDDIPAETCQLLAVVSSALRPCESRSPPGGRYSNTLGTCFKAIIFVAVWLGRSYGACYAPRSRQLWPVFDTVGPERGAGDDHGYALVAWC